MKQPENSFKKNLYQDKTLYGLWLGIADTTVAEVIATCGFDWVTIDGEHAPFDSRSILAHLQTLAAYDVAAIVRTLDDDPARIKQVLDLGAQTLLVPMIDDAASAEDLVQATRYPPEGIRGIGTSLARGARWNAVDNHLAEANSRTCLIVQAETVLAMRNIADIASVDGVDAVFIGPSDLAASMGYVGEPGHPEVMERIEYALSVIHAAGKPSGILATDPKLARHFAGLGVRFIGVGVDTQLLRSAAHATLTAVGALESGEIQGGTY